MKNKFKIVLGVVPTRRNMFDRTAAMENKKQIWEKVNELKDDNVELVSMDWLNDDGFLCRTEDVGQVLEFLRQAKVDALFMPHCNFGCEEVVAKLGKALNKPVLLWGPRDETPPADFADRQADTQCGLFASSKALLRYGVPFTYIENCKVTDAAFEQGFKDFVRVASVVKAFRNMRIGQVCVRPKPFLSVMVNESELVERFGIEVIPISSTEILSTVQNILERKPEKLHKLVEDITHKVDCSTMSAEMLNNIAALELAFLETAEHYELSAIASECWSTFAHHLGIRPCFVFGDTTDRGLPVSCETDIHGAITSVLVTAAAMGETPNFLADLTIRHPQNDNGELLWHCGPFPKSLVKEGATPSLVKCVGQWELKGGDITLARFDALKGEYRLFADEAKGIDGPSTNGNYLWIETHDWVKWEKKFIYGPYIHHVAAIHGKYAGVLHEACKYMKGVLPDSADL